MPRMLALAILIPTLFSPLRSPAQEPAPAIRVSTHLVLVDVTATDRQGKPVTDLKREDFVVEENGKTQKIATFVSPAENQANAAATTLPPGIFSNLPQFRSPGGPIVVLVLDALNTPFKDQAYARDQMLKFVRDQYKPGQRMAIFALAGTLIRLQDFTTDPRVLYAAVVHHLPKLPQYGVAQEAPSDLGDGSADIATVSEVSSALDTFDAAELAFAEDRRVEITLNALDSLSRMLGGMTGRKSVVWVTGAFPFTLIPEERGLSAAELKDVLPNINTRRPDTLAGGTYSSIQRGSHTQEIRDAAARLSNAQVAIYPIDARGLSISTHFNDERTMREIADETGGRVYVNQNEIKDGVALAFADNSSSYTLGYYPENKKFDGEYRHIKTKIAREGLELHYRKGYYATDFTPKKDSHPEQGVAAALGDAAPATTVPFTVRVKSPADNAVKGKVGVDFLVDANSISGEDTSAGKHLDLAFYAAFVSAGKVLSPRSIKVDRTFDQKTYQQMVQQGIMLHMDLDPQATGFPLILAVHDNHSGLIGTVRAFVPQ